MHRASQQNPPIDIQSVIFRLNKIQSNTNSPFPLTQQQVQALCYLTRMSLSAQPMLLQLKPPINICGDIHGQYRDLLSLISTIGQPSEQSYLFLGDYVDRGKRSLQCFCLLMVYKVKHPNNFFMLRGNHECSEVNKIYGFYDQVKRKFNIKLWKNICDTFDYLPIAAVVGDRIFCVHGGLSPQLKNIRDLNAFKRPLQPLKSTVVSDMLWADPSPLLQGWNQNIDRGVSYYYGTKVINSFLKKYDFDLICRSHQVIQQGYEFFNQRTLITIFSAPNYCGDFQNLGAVLKVDSNMKCSVQQFQSIVYTNIVKKPRRSLTPIPNDKRDASSLKKQSTTHQPNGKQNQDQNKQNNEKKVIEGHQYKNNPRKVTNLYMLRRRLEQQKSQANLQQNKEGEQQQKNP